LVTVFEQQCSVKDQADETECEDLPEIELRDKPAGKKIISSPHNTDAEYTRKRDQKVVGHKGFLTETCDPENPVRFITDVNLEKATHSDSEEISEIEDRLESDNFKPEELQGDAGFVNGKSILEAESKGIRLEGPSSGRSQSIEKFRSVERPLDVADFEVKIENDSEETVVLSCPNKQEPTDQARSEKTGKLSVHFDNVKCKECPLNARCPVKIGVRVSTLTIDEEQYTGAERHHKYMSDSDYRKRCGIRAGAESLVNEVANSHGARKYRHKSERLSKLQLIFGSIACNVKRYLRYKAECAQNQPKLAEVRV